jgi:hypothetical protein
MNKAQAAGRTSPLPEQDFKAPVTEQQLRDAVTQAFAQQYGRGKEPTAAFMEQWMAEAKRIAEKDGTTQFLMEKVFSAMNKAQAAGRTSPLPEQDFKAPVTEQQLREAVEFAFKQQFNAKPTDNELRAWMAEAKKIAERDGTTQYLGEKVFSELNKAASRG